METYESLEAILLAKPGARRDFPFGEEVAVFKVMGKMFALVAWRDDPLRISLKSDPMDAIQLRTMFPAVQPGYHLNKDHWNTVTLDGSIPNEIVADMIDDSYDLVVKKLRKADRDALQAQG